MVPEEAKLLERTAALAEENNKILRGMRRNARIGTLFHLLYWIVIIAVSYGAYIYVKPYVVELEKVLVSVKGAAGNIQKVGSQLPDFQGLLNNFSR